MSATYDENVDGIAEAWSYCEERLRLAEVQGIQTNANYKGIYRSFIQWVELYSAQLAMVNENENDNAAPLESYVSCLGTVYITQYNVETYFTKVVVNQSSSSRATLKKKLVPLIGY